MTVIDSANVFAIPAGRQRARKTTSKKDRLTLEKLQKKRFDELDRLFSQLAAPNNLSTLNGRKQGVLLTIAGLHRTPVGSLLNLLGKSPFFPWSGKNFSARSLIKGSGINRINLTITKQEWFAFQTSFKPSLVDRRPCVQLNYNLQGNPWLVRQLVDELREVEPGLYLGATLYKTSRGKIKLLYFAIGE